MKPYVGYEPTVGELIDVLKKCDRNDRIWFSCYGKTGMDFPPVGTAGHYGNKYRVTIDEGSYQNTIYMDIRK